MDFHGKVAVVTGGGNGIGRALSGALAQRGARVAVADIDGEAAETVAGSIGGVAARCDVSDESDIQALVVATEDLLGRSIFSSPTRESAPRVTLGPRIVSGTEYGASM